jgi:hypothetical protein
MPPWTSWVSGLRLLGSLSGFWDLDMGTPKMKKAGAGGQPRTVVFSELF